MSSPWVEQRFQFNHKSSFTVQLGAFGHAIWLSESFAGLLMRPEKEEAEAETTVSNVSCNISVSYDISNNIKPTSVRRKELTSQAIAVYRSQSTTVQLVQLTVVFRTIYTFIHLMYHVNIY